MVKAEDKIEILDISSSKKGKEGWLDDFLQDLTKASVAKQLTVGGLTGWCSGYLCAKVGRAAATAVGGSMLLIQFAAHKGYIQINWGKVNKEVEKAKKELSNEIKQAEVVIPGLFQETKRFVKDNVILASGFTGGFLVGIASS